MLSDGKTLNGGLLSGQKLFGYKVENPRGEGLGRLEDLMISAEGGQIAYAVVSFGGALSLKTKLFAFPWSALHVDNAKKKVILNLDKKTLAKARGFDKDHWPDSSEWNWDSSAPLPTASVTVAPERAAMSVARHEMPALAESPAIETPVASKDRMEQWGKSWQSHGLDRS